MNNKNNVKINKSVVGNVVAISISALLIVLSFCGRYFSGALRTFCNFFVGTFGMSFFGIAIAVIVACAFRLSGKKITIPTKYIINFVAMYIVITILVHTFSTRFLAGMTYEQYTSYCFDYYTVPSFGGVVFGTIAFGLEHALHIAGSIIVLCLALGVTVIFAGSFAYDLATNNIKLYTKVEKSDYVQPVMPVIETQPIKQDMQQPTQTEKDRAMDILFGEEQPVSHIEVSPQFDTVAQSKLNNDQPTETVADFSNKTAEAILFGSDEQLQSPTEFKTNTFFTERDKTVSKPLQSTTTTPTQPIYDDTWLNDTFTTPATPVEEVAQQTASEILFKPVEDTLPAIDFTEGAVEDESEELPFGVVEAFVPQQDEIVEDIWDEESQPEDCVVEQPEELQPIVIDNSDTVEEYVFEDDLVDEFVDDQVEEEEEVVEEPIPAVVVPIQAEEKPQYSVKTIHTPVKGGIQQGFDIVETDELEQQQSKVHQYAEYQKPPMELLKDEVVHVDNEGELRQEYTKRIVDKLAVYGILVEPVDPIVGPTITRYQFRVLSEKTRMGDFAKYTDDLKACLESQYDIRIQAPIPGTNLVGIEVPNKTRAMVVLRPILESQDFENAKGELVFAIGKEISGKNIVTDLAPMPHLLVSGASGSGKSVALHNIVVSLMYKYSPEYVRFIMVDPKMVELSKYNGSPHMLIEKAITQVTDTLAALDYLIKEMEARYVLLAEKGVSKISEYNQVIDPKYTQKLPYIVLIVEELADLMAVSKSQVEGKLVRLAQKARAAGIHLILATQRPSVDVVTGLIKANVSCRMALNAASADDSRTMLGGGGAEKLLKHGDMLFVNTNESPVPVRIQGAYLSNLEIKALVEYLTQSNEVYFPEEVTNAIYAKPVEEEIEQSSGKKADAPKENGLDPYCKRCMRYWLEKNHGKASASSIQRSQNIGFNRAGKILDQLTDLNYIEAPLASESNTKPRKVLITIEQLDELFPDMEG